MYSEISIGKSIGRRVNLLNNNGFCISDWRPVAGKDEIIFRSSVYGEGRRPVMARADNAVERLTLELKQSTPDLVAYESRRLRNELTDAMNYWSTSDQIYPVYIKIKAVNEENYRYAHIIAGDLEEDDNPFIQPLAGPISSGMGELPLVIERLPWASHPPTTGGATEIKAYQDWCDPHYLVVDNIIATDLANWVRPPEEASFIDLPDSGATSGTITVQGWIHPLAWGVGSNTGIFIAKSVQDGWWFEIDNAVGLRATIEYTGNDAISTSGLDEFSINTWSHVLFTYDETGGTLPAARTIYLAVNGVWVATYPTQQPSTLNFVSASGDPVYIGGWLSGTYPYDSRNQWAFNGYIGWMAIHDDIVYDPAGGNFTPISRCTLPAMRTDLVGLWIAEGDFNWNPETRFNYIRNFVSGVPAMVGASTEWADCDCDVVKQGRGATTTEEVYIGNEDVRGSITHILRLDESAATYFDIMDVVPADILAPGPAVGDKTYFGSDTSQMIGGPFNSLIFDIDDVAEGVAYLGEWQYRADGGPWRALDVIDYTDLTQTGTRSWTVPGVNSICWLQPDDWDADMVVNGIEAYWVRFVVTGIGTQVPVQQNRNIYTVNWSYLTIPEDSAGGDIDSLIKESLRHVSELESSNDSDDEEFTYTQRVIVGLRTMERGETFRAFVNLMWPDTHNQSSIEVSGHPAETSCVVDSESPSGWATTYNPTSNRNMQDEVYINFRGMSADAYVGRFHIFLRCKQVGGNAGDIGIRLGSALTEIGYPGTYYGRTLYTQTVDPAWELIDLGEFTLPPVDINQLETVDEQQLVIQLSNTNYASVELHMFDLALIPVDEWACDAAQFITPSNTVNLSVKILTIDSVGNPKRSIETFNRTATAEEAIRSMYIPYMANRAIIHQEGEQRLWHLSAKGHDNLTLPWSSWPQVTYSVRLSAQKRYRSMRGAG